MILALTFRYNPRHSRRDVLIWLIPNNYRESKRRKRRDEKNL